MADTQHVGGTVMVVLLDVDPAGEEEFNRWYNEQHIPERLDIPATSAPAASSWNAATKGC